MLEILPVCPSALLHAALAHVVALLTLLLGPALHIRIPAFLLTVILVRQAISAAGQASGLSEQFCVYMAGYVLYANTFLVLDRISVPSGPSIGRRFSDASRLLFSPRLGVRRGVIPPFDYREPSRVPSRAEFLRQRVWAIIWMSALYNYQFSRYRLQVSIDDYAFPKEYLIRRLLALTVREAVMRIYITFTSVFSCYSVISITHGLASLVGVFIFQDDPAKWPPLYGSARDAYTIRRYYSHFWHRVMRRAHVANAKFLVLGVFRLSSSNIFSRYVVTVVALLISGFMHSIASTSSKNCADLGQFWYFVFLGCAILMEDLIQMVYRKLCLPAAAAPFKEDTTKEKAYSGDGGKSDNNVRHTLGDEASVSTLGTDRTTSKWRFLGYFWVMFFECWAIPRAIYPSVRCQWRESRRMFEASKALKIR